MAGKDEITVNLMDMEEEAPSSSSAMPMSDPFQQLATSLSGSQNSWNSGLHETSSVDLGVLGNESEKNDTTFVPLSGPGAPVGPGPVPLPDLSAAPLTTTTTTAAVGGGGSEDPFAASTDASVNLLDAGPSGTGDGGNGSEGDGSDGKDKGKVTWNPLLFLTNRLAPYFDVDTMDIVNRTVNATAKGYAGNFADFVEDKPDLYGPFWIATTLIVVSSASGSFAQYLSGVSKDDIDKVTASCFFFYGYVTALPLAIWGLLIYHKQPMRLLNLIGIYGYAMAVFIPTAILCTVPNAYVRWALILVAAAISGLSIVMNVRRNFMAALQAKGTLYLAAIAGLHLCLAVGLNFYFFLY